MNCSGCGKFTLSKNNLTDLLPTLMRKTKSSVKICKKDSCLPKTSWLPLLFLLLFNAYSSSPKPKKFRQLPFTEKRFIFLRSPSGATVGFAFQILSLCVTPASCLVSSHRHSPLLSCFSRTGWIPYDASAFDEEKQGL